MSTPNELRHTEIRSFTASSFHAEHAREDIATFKHAVYNLAQAYNLFEVVITDADAVNMNTPRVAARVRPAELEPNASAAVIKHFDNQTKLFEDQLEKRAKLKLKVTQTMDHATAQTIGDPINGLLFMDVHAILEALVTAFNTLTINELGTIEAEWASRRWDGGDDLVTFMANFRDTAAFLQHHNNAQSEARQVFLLKNAVQHVPLFADMANAAFHATAPTVAQQTAAQLINTYTQVYRNQYVNTTAAQHHRSANQATTLADDPHAPAIAGIMASVRGCLPTTPMTHEQLMELQAEVAKLVTRTLKPGKPAPQDIDRPFGGRNGGKGAERQHRGNDRPTSIPAGVCPLHPHALKPHLWEQCKQNKNK
jgi:hypothetical protein